MLECPYYISNATYDKCIGNVLIGSPVSFLYFGLSLAILTLVLYFLIISLENNKNDRQMLV